MEVINEKYDDFVGLSGQLGGVEGAIVRIAKPLTDIQVTPLRSLGKISRVG